MATLTGDKLLDGFSFYQAINKPKFLLKNAYAQVIEIPYWRFYPCQRYLSDLLTNYCSPRKNSMASAIKLRMATSTGDKLLDGFSF